MQSISIRPARRLSILAAVTALLVLGLVAGRYIAPSRPPIVAHIDIEGTITASNVYANKKAEVENGINDLDAQVKALAGKVDALGTELEAYQQDSPKAAQMQGPVQAAIAEYRAYEQFARVKVEALRAQCMRETYEELKRVVAIYARENNIDYVFLDDSVVEMDKGNSVQTLSQISARRFLYATPEFDVSTDIVARLNKEIPLKTGVTAPKPFSARGAAAATTAAANP